MNKVRRFVETRANEGEDKGPVMSRTDLQNWGKEKGKKRREKWRKMEKKEKKKQQPQPQPPQPQPPQHR